MAESTVIVALVLVLILLRELLLGSCLLYALDLVQHSVHVILAILDYEFAPYPASVLPNIRTGHSELYELKLAI